MNDSKQTLSWFEARVGSFIYREPIFESEKNKSHVAMKIKDKAHAKILFDLQRPGRPRYEDKPENFKSSRIASR